MARDVSDFQSLPPSAGVLDDFCRQVAETLHIDAVQILGTRQGNVVRIAGAEPDPSVAQNLTRTAIPFLSDSGDAFQKSFQFDGRAVHLLAHRIRDDDWLLVWAALTNPNALELARQVVGLAALACPGSRPSTSPLTDLGTSLPSAPASQVISRWIVDQSSGAFVFFGQKSLWGWRLVASGPEKPARAGGLAREIRRAFSDPDGGIALEQIALLTGSESAVRLTLDRDLAVIVAGPATMEPKADELRAIARLIAPHRPSIPEAWRKINRRTAMGVAGVLLVIAIIPLPDRVRAPVVLEPSLRRYVASPFDAVLKQVHGRRGDVVKTGDVLVEIDGRETAERLAEVESKLASAKLESASDLEGSNYAAAVLRGLDAESLSHELAVLQHRRDNLILRAPIDGVVIGGELERARGAAVELGHPLLEIAPLDPLVAEFAVPDTEISLIRAGQRAEIQLDAFPSRRIPASLERVRPRSEPRDGRNVFIAEAQISNADLDLRPGMRGRGVIVSSPKPLIWLLIRKPWRMASTWLFR